MISDCCSYFFPTSQKSSWLLFFNCLVFFNIFAYSLSPEFLNQHFIIYLVNEVGLFVVSNGQLAGCNKWHKMLKKHTINYISIIIKKQIAMCQFCFYQIYIYILDLTFTIISSPIIKLIKNSNSGNRIKCICKRFVHVDLLFWNIQLIQALE